MYSIRAEYLKKHAGVSQVMSVSLFIQLFYVTKRNYRKKKRNVSREIHCHGPPATIKSQSQEFLVCQNPAGIYLSISTTEF